MAKVSIAIPTWEAGGRGAEFTAFLLQSIAGQDRPPYEVCISDHSLDEKVRAVAHVFQEQHPEIDLKYKHNPDGRGNSSVNTNAAIEMCSGDIIKIMFQDDAFVSPEALSQTVAAFADPQVGWCVLPSNQLSDDGNRYRAPKLASWNPKIHVGVNTIGSPSVIAFRRTAIPVHMSLFDPHLTYLMDCDAYCKLFAASGMPAVIDAAPSVGNREHANQMTRKLHDDVDERVRFQQEKVMCKRRWGQHMARLVDTRKQPKSFPRPGQGLRGLCINLAHRKDRWAQFQQQCQANPVIHSFFSQFRRFEAIKGVQMAPRLPPAEAGAVGCGMSHITALNKLASTAASPNELVMVVEDDIQIVDYSVLQRLTQGLPTLAASPEWMVLLLAFSTAKTQPIQSRQLSRIGLVRVLKAMTTTGYIVRVRHIPLLVRTFQAAVESLRSGTSRRNAAIDVAWLPLQKQRMFIAFKTKLATQRPGHSDIEGHHCDYTPMFASAGQQITPQPTAAVETASSPIFYVCSYGGCGSTLLSAYLANIGSVKHVHSRRPPRTLQHVGTSRALGSNYHEWFNGVPVAERLLPVIRVIYLYRDPVRATLSRFHNPIHRKHVQMANPSRTIQDVISTNKDLFGLEEFFDNYTCGEKQYKVICVKYEAMFEELSELHTALGLPPPAGGSSGLKRSENRPDQQYIDALEPVYSRLKKKMANMKMIEIR
jgi:hypothetical protein